MHARSVLLCQILEKTNNPKWKEHLSAAAAIARSGAKTMTLQDEALRLAELKRQLVQMLDKGCIEKAGHALSTYLELKASLKQRMLDEPTISVEDAGVREVLHTISKEVGEFDDAAIEKLGAELLYPWFSHHDYVRALDELRPLILQCDTSESVKRLVGQVRGCYAFQQYDAAFGLCRTVLEASIRDICVRQGLFHDLSENAVLYEKLNWCKLRNKVSCGQLNKKLKDLYGRLCEVLHAQRAAVAKDAREVFQETLLVIEELYEFHGL